MRRRSRNSNVSPSVVSKHTVASSLCSVLFSVPGIYVEAYVYDDVYVRLPMTSFLCRRHTLYGAKIVDITYDYRLKLVFYTINLGGQNTAVNRFSSVLDRISPSEIDSIVKKFRSVIIRNVYNFCTI